MNCGDALAGSVPDLAETKRSLERVAPETELHLTGDVLDRLKMPDDEEPEGTGVRVLVGKATLSMAGAKPPRTPRAPRKAMQTELRALDPQLESVRLGYSKAPIAYCLLPIALSPFANRYLK